MQTLNKTIEPTPSQKLSNYMDSCTISEYQKASNLLRDKLGWSRTTLANKRSGKSPITPAEVIAIPLLLNVNIF